MDSLVKKSYKFKTLFAIVHDFQRYRVVISRLRDPGFEIRDRDLNSGRDSETQNHPKTILRDQSQALPRFRDWAKIFQTQVFRGTIL